MCTELMLSPLGLQVRTGWGDIQGPTSQRKGTGLRSSQHLTLPQSILEGAVMAPRSLGHKPILREQGARPGTQGGPHGQLQKDTRPICRLCGNDFLRSFSKR